MDLLQTDEALASGKVALLVFLPDAVRARLVNAIELWVRERTGCVPVAREWVRYTEETLERFYPGVAASIPEAWPLFVELFATGPCLATLWLGADASRVIPSVKGATHPAHSAKSTIRGRFWCDNPTANLVHVSDGCEAAVRELLVLRSSSAPLFQQPLPMLELAGFGELGPSAPAHSAILTLCALVATHLANRENVFPRLLAPEGGEARETMARAEAWLGHVLAKASDTVRGAVETYLNGTARPSRFIDALANEVALDPWEELILRAGVLSRGGWLEGR